MQKNNVQSQKKWLGDGEEDKNYNRMQTGRRRCGWGQYSGDGDKIFYRVILFVYASLIGSNLRRLKGLHGTSLLRSNGLCLYLTLEITIPCFVTSLAWPPVTFPHASCTEVDSRGRWGRPSLYWLNFFLSPKSRLFPCKRYIVRRVHLR